MFGMDKLSRHRRWRETRRRTKVRRVAKFVHSKNAFIKRKHAILRVFFILGLSCKSAETSFAFTPAFLRSGLFLHFLFLFIEISGQYFCLPFRRKRSEFCRKSAHSHHQTVIVFRMFLCIKQLFFGYTVQLQRLHCRFCRGTQECFARIKRHSC